MTGLLSGYGVSKVPQQVVHNNDKGLSGKIIQYVGEVYEQKMIDQGASSVRIELLRDADIDGILILVDGLDISPRDKKWTKGELRQYLVFRRNVDGILPNITHLSVEDRPYILGIQKRPSLNSYTPLLAAWDSTLPTLTTF
ncbi:hypothetical protein AUK10_04300 [Candidatus Gracilibacteria bacterium CG2_30_37_12]|nr:MAG: hypothetical protein AUK10_04300 [Candidatus Gracilibacteria bacterium CG2_30_37_12]